MNAFIVSIPNSPGELLSSLFECWFLNNQPQSTLGISGFFLSCNWMLRCQLKAEVMSGEAGGACVPSGMVQKNSFARVSIKT